MDGVNHSDRTHPERSLLGDDGTIFTQSCTMRFFRHYLILVAIIAMGAMLRFANLETKALWLDEILTILFSLGKGYNDVPLDALLPVTKFADIFTLNPDASCAQIAETVAMESTHPPLFFCLTHQWMSAVGGSLAWQARSLSAFFGVVAIAAIYALNRLAFSPVAGLMAAAVMAVSPFAVYLSQEARHYTLPMLLIILSLLGLVQIQKDLYHYRKISWIMGIGWAIANTIGLYTHYFFLLALLAEIATLVFIGIVKDPHPVRVGLQEQSPPTRAGIKGFLHNKVNIFFQGIAKNYLHIFGFCLLPFLLYLPWLPILFADFDRPETEWFKPVEPSWTDSITPIVQTVAGWVMMVVALPVENQPLWIAIPAGLLMLIFVGWLVWQIGGKLINLFTTKSTFLSSTTLALFTGFVVLEYLGIVYVLGKDITSAVRYHFIYYPGICALLGAYLTRQWGKDATNRVSTMLVIVGAISSVLVVTNFVFQKPYNPFMVAQQMNLQPAVPLVVVVGYENPQEIALGLSFALAMNGIRDKSYGENVETYFGLMQRSPSYLPVWEQLAQMQKLPPSPLNLWLVAPGLRQRQYPPQFALGDRTCNLDPAQYYRLGIPYQLYRCGD